MVMKGATTLDKGEDCGVEPHTRGELPHSSRMDVAVHVDRTPVEVHELSRTAHEIYRRGF